LQSASSREPAMPPDQIIDMTIILTIVSGFVALWSIK
jgi:hypothetical protein